AVVRLNQGRRADDLAGLGVTHGVDAAIHPVDPKTVDIDVAIALAVLIVELPVPVVLERALESARQRDDVRRQWRASVVQRIARRYTLVQAERLDAFLLHPGADVLRQKRVLGVDRDRPGPAQDVADL